ncbi:MAG: UDP-N-acetylmuramoyl-L-alanine--D-glutamate ligase [Thermoleophilia bacterium]
MLGLARSGRAAALALRAAGVEVVAVDRAAVLADDLRAAGIEPVVGDDDPALLDGCGLLVKSPGVPPHAPLVLAARGRGIPVWSEVELGFRLLDGPPLVGVTGTNGKTTTTELLGAILRAAGRPVEVAGNVGRPLCSLVGALAQGAWVVCELSSFQLEDVELLRPRVAVLLNLTPDHLDRHGTVEAYRAAKLRLFERMGPGDVAVVPAGFGPLPGAARRVAFSATDELPAEPRIPGAHNRENAAAATAAARAAGVPDAAIAEALRTFAGVEHRLERVAEVRGVQYVNDSKATNPDSAERGLAAYPGARVILGGSRKGTPFEGLARVARETGVLRAYLIGDSAPLLAEALAAAGVPFEQAGDLATAVERAAADAQPGEVVLLSPACASYDQFANFEQRGARFRELVAAL